MALLRNQAKKTNRRDTKIHDTPVNEASDFDYDEDEEDFVLSDYSDISDSEDDDDAEFADDDDETHTNMEFRHEEKTKYPSPLEFKTHTTSQLVKEMSAESTHLKELFQLTTEQTLTLLHYFAWNSERLIDQYTENPTKVLEEVGLTFPESNHSLKSSRKHYKDGEFDCMICCNTVTDTYQLKCGHEFCIDCYKHYVGDKLADGKIIKCPSCDIPLTVQDIDNISGQGQSDKLMESSIREYVERKPHYKWCPSPDCDIIIEIQNSSEIPTIVDNNEVPVATCDHGHQFCVYCNYENHFPAPCTLADKWIKKCHDDSETVNWLTANTKQCPRCSASIEKNGGCNHMTCRKCLYEFCWICMGDWKKHKNNEAFQCNRFTAKTSPDEVTKKVNVNMAKRTLQRYIHFYNLFHAHDVSIKQDTARCLVVEETVRTLQEESGISWIEAQFLVENATTLLQARRVLKWSYAAGFYCEDDSYFQIFENVQANLADAVEALSKLFEIEEPQKIVDSKLEFLNRQRFLIDRKNAMIGCVKEAIVKKTLNMSDLGS